MSNATEPLYWYCFSYSGKTIDTNDQCVANVYSGLNKKKITKTIIEERKKIAGVTNNSVLISVSYLGRMTEKEFIDAKQ